MPRISPAWRARVTPRAPRAAQRCAGGAVAAGDERASRQGSGDVAGGEPSDDGAMPAVETGDGGG
jgi:hypothetical protein